MATRTRLNGTFNCRYIACHVYSEQTEAEETAEHRELTTVNTINVKETKNVNLSAYENSITDCKSAARM